MEIIVLVISVLLGFWVNNLQSSNNKKKEVYESFLLNLQLVHFGHDRLLIIPNDANCYKDVHQAKIDLLKNYEQLKIWGDYKILENCSQFFYHIKKYDKELNQNHQISNVRSQEITNLIFDDYIKIINSMRRDISLFKLNTKLPKIELITYGRDDNLVIQVDNK